MKKRRFAIFAFLLVACLMLGIGYAAVSRNLDITGSASSVAPTESTFDVIFSNVGTPVKGDNSENLVVSTNEIQIDRHVVLVGISNFDERGDEITLSYEIEYETQVAGIDAELSSLEISNDQDDYFEITYTYVDDDQLLTADDPTTTLQVTVKLIAVPTENIKCTFALDFNATAVTAQN